ncbi:hypothetical protein D3C72_2287390 [compost metagenome]
MPTTVDAAPVADAPKPPADAFPPDAIACAAVTPLSDTNGPVSPLLMLLTAESNPLIAPPTFEYVAPCTP